MELSVVIICWNSIADLSQLLCSLPSALHGIEHEVIVIDNGSTDGTSATVSHEYPWVKYMRLPCNKGVAYARNRGMERAAGNYILLLDDDTIATPTSMHTMLDYMRGNPGCGICACSLVNPEGDRQASAKPFPSLLSKIKATLGMQCDDPYENRTATFEPVYVIGACQLIRREVIQTIGYLDESIFYGPEDADYCLRARKAGWGIAYIPSAKMIHKWKRITSHRPFGKIGRAHIRGLIHFYLKHRRVW